MNVQIGATWTKRLKVVLAKGNTLLKIKTIGPNFETVSFSL